MPEFVTKMSSSMFVMRLPNGDGAAIEVKITGKGLVYDRDTGVLLRGNIDSITLSDLSQTGRRFDVVESRSIGGVGLTADRISDAIGHDFWNHVKVVIEVFDKLSSLNEGMTHSYFSPKESIFKGSELADKIAGTKAADVIWAAGGNDRLNAGNGDDTVDGGMGNDQLNGGNGNDLLVDLFGNNSLNGGAGHDNMRGSDGNDRLTGAAGRDILFGAGGDDIYSGGRDADVFVFDTKTESRIIITDFDRGDMFVNLASGSAAETYKYFDAFARQVGRDVVYDFDGLHLLLKNTNLDAIGEHNFTDAGVVKDAGLLF